MILKCSTCKTDVPDFKEHVKSLLHTYNLRRQTVGLGPVSYEAFKAKQAGLIIVEEPHKTFRCCSKTYKCQKTYDNHLNSKKHLKRPVEARNASEAEEEASEEEDEVSEKADEALEEEEESSEEEEVVEETPLTITDCLFCIHSSRDFATNLVHMTKTHGFSFPYPDFLVDPEGLMKYLINLIDTFSVCFKCDKQFYDRMSVRNHMFDRNHSQINVHLDNNADILLEFYKPIPQPLSDLDSALAEERLPNGKLIGNRQFVKYFNQNLNGLSNTNHLTITSGMDKAKMSLIHVERVVKLAKPGLLTPTEKKLKSKEARYRQYRASRYSNFQAHYRHQILM